VLSVQCVEYYESKLVLITRLHYCLEAKIMYNNISKVWYILLQWPSHSFTGRNHFHKSVCCTDKMQNSHS